MKYHAQIHATAQGDYAAACEESPEVIAHGLSPGSALERLRDELRYRLEYCPCSSVSDDFVEIEVTRASRP
jgi:hypothetical protein